MCARYETSFLHVRGHLHPVLQHHAVPLAKFLSIRLGGLLEIPVGVSSPVRAFKSVAGNPPVVFNRVKGAYAWDVDENKYIDYVGTWGPAILGLGEGRRLRPCRRFHSHAKGKLGVTGRTCVRLEKRLR